VRSQPKPTFLSWSRKSSLVFLTWPISSVSRVTALLSAFFWASVRNASKRESSWSTAVRRSTIVIARAFDGLQNVGSYVMPVLR